VIFALHEYDANTLNELYRSYIRPPILFQVAHGLNVQLLRYQQKQGRYTHITLAIKHEATPSSVHSHNTGTLKVGKTLQVMIVTYKRKRVGPKYKGTVLFMKMMQHNVMPTMVDNFFTCAVTCETSLQYVRVQDLCTLLAEVAPRSENPNMVNLVPIAHAFPVSWCVS
jgi:hypothetical protein